MIFILKNVFSKTKKIVDFTLSINEKIMPFLKVILGFSVSILILYEVDKLKNALKSTFFFMESKNFTLGLSYKEVLNLSSLIRELSLKYILTFTLWVLLNLLILKIIDKIFINRTTFSSPFDLSLSKYLSNKNDKKVYLVTGDWGSGKTHIVTSFLEKYFKFSNRKIYYISCFGLESREEVLREIKEQLELTDNSFFNLIQYIPVIGQPIYSLLKQSYSLSNIKKDSIFIFDDFERISAIGLKHPSKVERPFRNRTVIKGLDEVNKEFQKVQESISRIQRNEEDRYYFENYQKYNVVTGFINELVETYNQKAIIICNVDILGYEFVDVVFRGKLDCITYTKTVNSQSIKSVSNQVLVNQVFSDTNTQNRITKIFEIVLTDFENVINAYGEINLRDVKSIFQSYVETTEFLFNKSTRQISDDYLISVFYNIAAVKYLTNERKLNVLENINIGGVLSFYLDLYDEKNFFIALSSSKYFSLLRWTGIEISGYWLLNLTKPHEIDNLINKYDKYSYILIENRILLDNTHEILNEKLLLEHILYLTNKFKNPKDESLIINNVLSYLNSKNLTIRSLLLNTEERITNKEITYTILEKSKKISSRYINQTIFQAICEKIYNEYKIEKIEGQDYIYKDYNEIVVNIKSKASNKND